MGLAAVACESLAPPQGRRGFAEQIFGGDEQAFKVAAALIQKMHSGRANSVRASKKGSALPATQSGRADRSERPPHRGRPNARGATLGDPSSYLLGAE
jgi:hypothetical protein